MRLQKILPLLLSATLALTVSTEADARRGGGSRGFSHYAKHIATAGLAAGTGVAAHSAYSHVKRSTSAKNDFKHDHPCPTNGNRSGSCPGYVIDHITPIACGGADAPSNMQWQTVAEGKAKDKWERDGCTVNGAASNLSVANTAVNATDSAYHVGKRGGCYTYTAGGNKRYVDHSFCFGK